MNPVPGARLLGAVRGGPVATPAELTEAGPERAEINTVTVRLLNTEAESLSGGPEAPTDVQPIAEEFARQEPAALKADALVAVSADTNICFLRAGAREVFNAVPDELPVDCTRHAVSETRFDSVPTENRRTL